MDPFETADFFRRKIPLDEMLPLPARVRAEHVSGRSTDAYIDIENFRLISKGDFGFIYEVKARTVGAVPIPGGTLPFDSRRKSNDFNAVIKIFVDPQDAQHAISLYDICTDAGLRTTPTYRIDARQGVAIMTQLNRKGAVAISGNNWSIAGDELLKNKITRIDNWSDILLRLFSMNDSQVNLATNHLIELQEDLYFFIVPLKTDLPVLDFVACDFDAVKHPSEKDSRILLQNNVIYIRTTCERFVLKYVRPDRRQMHLRMLDEACAPFLPDHARRVAD